MKVVTADEMRRLEEAAFERGVTQAQLMERAGRATAAEVRRVMQGAAGRRVVVLVGPGNNGGDGLVAARYLSDWGALAQVFLLAPRSLDDPNYRALLLRDVDLINHDASDFSPRLQAALGEADTTLDAVLGTGRSRPLDGVFKAALEACSAARRERPALRLVAVDVPSGLDADSGAVDPATPEATLTVTFGFPKHGQLRFPGAGYVGELVVADIGIPDKLAQDIPTELLDRETIRALLPARPWQSNKGSFGRVLIVAGSGNYRGAAALASQAAVRAGAGLVTLAAPRSVIAALAGAMPEVTYLPLPETAAGALTADGLDLIAPLLPSCDALLVGCGLGQAPETAALLAALLLGQAPLPGGVVFDADALNYLATVPGWWRWQWAPMVLTPHPGEMARLLESNVADVQADRVKAARDASSEWNKVVALKGAFTVVAAPDGRCRIAPFANPALASAGTGDVLAGITVGLLAQGLSCYDASSAAVFLHGLAGEWFVAEHGGSGLAASDLIRLLPDAFHELAGPNPVSFQVRRATTDR